MARAVRVILVMILAAAAGAGGWFAVQHLGENAPANKGTVTPDGTQPAAGGKGKLVVLVVFDQLRGDYLDRWATAFGPDGFERLKREGAWFAHGHIPYACTSTGPGHASIVTGAPPSVHGIVENAWLDRGENRRGEARLMDCVQPSREFALVPALPAGAGRPERGRERGFSPENLLAPTVSDVLRNATQGKSRVVSLSIKDRAAVLMGGKATGTNNPSVYCFDLRDGRFHTDAYYASSVPPWVREFNGQRQQFDQWVGKTWDRLRTDLDYTRLAGPDVAAGENFGYNQSRKFPHPMNDKAPHGGPEYYRALEASPFANDVLLGFAKAAVTGENLGNNDTTDLLCVSFSANDLIGHQWGPDSWEVLDATLRSDRLVGEMVTFLDERLGRERYTLVVTADHGVSPIPEQKKLPTADRRRAGPLLHELAQALDVTFGPAETPAQWFDGFEFAEEVWPWVYLNRGRLKQRGIPFDAVNDYAAAWLGQRAFTQTAFTRKNIETGTLPPMAPDQQGEAKELLASARLAFQPERCGDVLVIPRPGVLITKYPHGTSHGSPHSYDTHVPILAFGADIPAVGRRNERVSSLIVAPLLAKALGLPPLPAATEPVPAALALPVK